jgi:Dolichyl-phosphate-mannose-protein mannosyltransferase
MTKAFLDRLSLAVLVVLAVGGVSISVLIARGRPFEHDEVFTILVSSLPSLPAIWSAELDGVDFFPPLNDFMTHGVHGLLGTGPIVTRLPAMVSFWGMSLVVFEIVRRRSNPTTALAAFAVPFLSGAFLYSYEARGYGPMLALFAVVLFAWLEAARGNRRRLYLPLLSVTLAASIWNHYFGILVLLPLGAGEAVRLNRTRRPDWGVYAAVGAAALLVIPLWPLIHKTAVDASPVRRPESSLRVLADTYFFLIGFLSARRFLAVAAVAVIVAAFRRWRGTYGAQFAGPRLAAHEVVAGLMCLAIPVAAVVLGAANGVFYNRYALPFTVGLAIVLPLALRWLASNQLVEALMAAVFAASFAQIGAQRLLAAPLVLQDPLQSHRVIAGRLHESEPIVVTGVEYLPLWYYAPPELRPRLWYIADPEATLNTFGSGTWDQNLLALRRYAPVNVAEYSSFAATASRFLVFLTRVEHWLLPRLLGDGAEIVQSGSDSGVPIYEVSFPGRGSSSVDLDPVRER